MNAALNLTAEEVENIITANGGLANFLLKCYRRDDTRGLVLMILQRIERGENEIV